MSKNEACDCPLHNEGDLCGKPALWAVRMQAEYADSQHACQACLGAVAQTMLSGIEGVLLLEEL